MKILDVLKGTGTVVSRSGNTAVQYDLIIYDAETRGWIHPCSGEATERLTLQMQDGTSIRFCFLDAGGNIRADDGVIPSPVTRLNQDQLAIVSRSGLGGENCCGSLIVIEIENGSANLVCSDCGAVVRTVPTSEASKTLQRMAMDKAGVAPTLRMAKSSTPS